MESSALNLATWIRGRFEDSSLTHLKLQKLVFYCFGAGLALDHEAELGAIRFEAWQHGPVNRDVWNRFRNVKAAPLPLLGPELAPRYSAALEEVLTDTLTVYGALDAWSLRQQTHLEQPWVDAYATRSEIEPATLRVHFRSKFRCDVRAPQYLAHSWNDTLDGLPTATFSSLRELAAAVSSMRAA